MKIVSLDLHKFGHFTDKSICFSTEKPGLHIVFGENEAGKSTTLRALTSFLYGFQERTADNFNHPNEQLLIGGCLQNNVGDEIHFLRRKKRKADILDVNGGILDSSVLSPFLLGVDRDVFETLYGIDHHNLVQGGRDILAQKGEVGLALFSSGAGIGGIKDIQLSLESEADDLFKPRGTRQEISRALAEYRQLDKQIKETSLSGRKWFDLNQSIENAKKELLQIEKEKGKIEKKKKQAELLARVMPYMGLRMQLTNELTAIGDVRVLPADFSERRRSLEKKQHGLKEKHAGAHERLKALKEKKENISVPSALIAQEELINSLYIRLGGYKKAMLDRPKLEGMRISCRNEAAHCLKQIRPDLNVDDLDVLLPFYGKRKVVLGYASQHKSLNSSLENARKNKNRASRNLEEAHDSLNALPEKIDAKNLENAVALARRAGELDTVEAGISVRLEAGLSKLQDNLSRIGLYKGELAALNSLNLPLSTTVQQFVDLFSENRVKKNRIHNELLEANQRLEQLKGELHELNSIGAVASESHLDEVRKIRDIGWRLIKKRLVDGKGDVEAEDAFRSDDSLADAYENRVNEADAVADRLRREVDKVHKIAVLQANCHSLKSKILALDKDNEECRQEAGFLQENWIALWEPVGFSPLSPKEMAVWLAEIDIVRSKYDELISIFEDKKSISAKKINVSEKLKEGLIDVGRSSRYKGAELSPLLMECEEVLKELGAVDREREKQTQKAAESRKVLQECSLELCRSEEELRHWTVKWQELSAIFGGDRGIMPEEAADIVEGLQTCFAKQKEGEDFQKRIEGIDRDAFCFEEDAEKIIQSVAKDQKGQPWESSISNINAMLGRAKEDNALYKKFEHDIQTTENEIIDIEVKMNSLAEQQEELRSLADCRDDAGLDAAERISADYLKLKNRIAEVEESIVRAADGNSIEALEVLASGVEYDELPGQINIYAHSLEQEISPEIKRLSELIGEKRLELQQLEQSTRAMELAEDAARLLAKIRRLCQRYTQLKVAAYFLKNEIERYRAENQGPILHIASDYFQKLTLNSFEGLKTDEDNQGNPVLVGTRNSSRIGVDNMSSGTRDQLYLSLRLASLKWRLQKKEPMPFIADDILINFDDLRSRAALEILADLSHDVQVILFTHHQRIVDAARGLGRDGVVLVHEI